MLRAALGPRLAPDAVLTVQVGGKALRAPVECNRSTEPARQWRDKAQKYARPAALPDPARCAWVDGLLREAGAAAWFVPRLLLGRDAFGQWRVSGGGLQPFLPVYDHPSRRGAPGGTAPGVLVVQQKVIGRLIDATFPIGVSNATLYGVRLKNIDEVMSRYDEFAAGGKNADLEFVSDSAGKSVVEYFDWLPPDRMPEPMLPYSGTENKKVILGGRLRTHAACSLRPAKNCTIVKLPP